MLSPSDGRRCDSPRLQILTVASLLAGHAQVQMPPEHQTFKQPERVKGQASHAQRTLFAGASEQDEDDADDNDEGEEE